MCGRFYLDAEREYIEQAFDVDLGNLDLVPRYNIAPSQPILTITQDSQGRHAQYMRWGLIPAWSKGVDARYSMINARIESIHEKPAYKRPFKRTRCLIPASGFYEWQKTIQGKQPFCIAHKDGDLLALAGIWDTWKGEGDPVHSCSIVTTTANEDVKDIHERMPVALAAKDHVPWLDSDNQNVEDLRQRLASRTDIEFSAWPISQAVNKPTHDEPDLIKAI